MSDQGLRLAPVDTGPVLGMFSTPVSKIAVKPTGPHCRKVLVFVLFWDYWISHDATISFVSRSGSAVGRAQA